MHNKASFANNLSAVQKNQCLLQHQTVRTAAQPPKTASLVRMKLLTIGICMIYGALAATEVLGATSKLAQLVPTINQENYRLMPIADTFKLSLNLPEGGYREEETKLLIDENGKEVLAVKGQLNLAYNDVPYSVTVIYEADGKGYRAKYMYVSNQSNSVYFTSASFLKTAAG